MRMGPRWTRRTDGLHEYEERITLWRVHSFDDAIAKAEADAHEYAGDIEVNYLGIAQAFALDEDLEVLGEGSEVFSLTRPHALPPEEYVDRYIETPEYRRTERYRHTRQTN
jgi:hypothetical protein